MSFEISLTNVLVTLFYILPGFLVCKLGKAKPEHLSGMSGVLVYACSPCMILSAFLALEYREEDLLNMALFFLITLAAQMAFMGIVYLFIRKKSQNPTYRLMTIGMVLGNVGFFGLPIVKVLLPNNPEVACYAAVYMVTMNLLVFTVGVFCLTGEKKYMSLKAAICNPTVLGFAVGFPLYLLGMGQMLPAPLVGSLTRLGNMSTPLCMIILGIRLATVPLRRLFTKPVVYLVCLGKLVLFPLFAFGAVYFLPLDPALKAAVLILSSTPCASVIFNLAEMHHGETELSANCVLFSTIMCFLSIPLLTMLL